MHLKSLSLVNFKNYEQADLNFSARINCFVGENGVGKTNLLDAVHYLALCKSNFNQVDSQNIRYEQDFCVIQGIFERQGKEENIYCGIKKDRKKQFKKNKKEYQKLSEHIGFVPLVMISPYDSILVNGGSEERRKFVNGVIAQYSRPYLENLIHYNRALNQRNSLLKDFASKGKFSGDLLEIWDEQLILYGDPVYSERKRFVEELTPVFDSYYRHVSGGKETVNLDYLSQLKTMDFAEGLKHSLQKDRVLQYTSFGIHKDDLGMKLENRSLKKTGSQGQQKTFLLALKLAEFDFIQKTMDLSPVLLLDDIFDKFDASRVKQIISLVANNHFGQIFITDTNETRMMGILGEFKVEYQVFKIEDGGGISKADS